ncbi:MAG: phosphate uptake regulator PhoU [Nitrososphaerota archaeon]|nr:phosphate uptake regulator PhoU [Nitrososphaerota archaeon]MDG7024506.1 phosphate uptake regulator PhoU [Nitrososphaerota archaeon]
MPSRKAIEMGKGTILVSLPKEWIRKNGIKKGAEFSVEEISPRKLLVSPREGAEDEQKEIVVDYPGDDIGEVTNDLTGAYLLGFDKIRIVGAKTITREDRAGIKTALGRLVGLEILDEDSRKISMQFLLEERAIIPETLVRRMSGLLDGMLKDVAEALTRGDGKLLTLVGERDDEVDRLYFLLVRATRAAVVRPEVAERYGLSPVDLLDYRVLASFLESIGDAVGELSRKLLGGLGAKRASQEYAACVTKLKKMNELATQGFISRRAGRPRTISKQVASMAQEVSQTLASVAKKTEGDSAATAEILASLERVSRLLVDVSDLAVITQQVS